MKKCLICGQPKARIKYCPGCRDDARRAVKERYYYEVTRPLRMAKAKRRKAK